MNQLTNMKKKTISGDAIPTTCSCTAIALAAWATELKDPSTLAKTIRNAAAILNVNKVKGWFANSQKTINKVYSQFNLTFTAAIIGGTRFPQTCILKVKSAAAGTYHIIARVNGVLIDAAGAESSKFYNADDVEIVGFWK